MDLASRLFRGASERTGNSMDGSPMKKNKHKATSKIVRESVEHGVRMIRVSVKGGFPYWRIDTHNRDKNAGAWRADYTTTLESAAERWFHDVVARRARDAVELPRAGFDVPKV